jgi:aminopeptidase N
VGLYDLDGERLVRRSSLDVDLPAVPRHEIEPLVGQPAADLVLPNDGDLTFALLDLDDASLATVRAHLRGLGDPLARALVWFALVEMVAAGRLAPSGLVELVTTSITADDPQAVTDRLLRATVVAADRWADPDSRPRLLADLARWLDAETRSAEPGSDRQLALARTLVRISQNTAALESWRQGTDLPDGLTVDADLRWRVVHRLATLGAIDEDDVATERERDRSTAGANFALTARAAMPTATAKEWAWSSAVDGNLSNHELIAVATGFWSADQAELLAPYVQRFADDYPQFARSQSTEMAQLFGRFMFPSTVVSAQTVQVVQQLLDAADLPPIALRMLAEGRDELERGLRARSAT